MTDGFLYYALIFLLSAVIVVPLAKRSGLGAILGYLLAGVIIGPFGMGFIKNPEAILHFAEFGVVMMLFLIGLELQPRTLWRLRKPILGLGGSQMGLTTVVIAVACMIMGLSWPVAMAIGLGLALSSTAIAIQLMNERNIFPTYTGQSAFSVLLFQDIAIIPILAVIPLLAVGSDVGSVQQAIEVVEEQAGGSLWEKGLMVIGMVALIIAIGHYAMRPALRYIAQTGVREIFTATALLLVVGVTFLMKSIGLSAALGAFIAGVILADSEYRHEIEAQIEPFKALLLGLFFISVGMSMNFDVLAADWATAIGALVGLLVIKFAVLFILAKWFKFDLSQNLIFSTLLAQGGEFGFVVFQFANQVNLINSELASMLNMTVALSMAATPLMLMFYDRVLMRRFKDMSGFDTLPEKPPVKGGSSPVLIFGNGRFGQVVARLLQANKIQTTILDHDPKQIDTMRRFGWEVFYGDVMDMELLHAAGAEKAKLLVLAINDRDKSVEAASLIKQKYPHLKIYARAYDRRHAYELSKVGVDYFERETFHAALNMGREVLMGLGYRAYEARNLALKFAKHDRKILIESFGYFEDEKALISIAQQSREELRRIFESDRTDAELHREEGWDEDDGNKPQVTRK
jgi:monovalent cation:proton antiporter-2 (CPA2) family protein